MCLIVLHTFPAPKVTVFALILLRRHRKQVEVLRVMKSQYLVLAIDIQTVCICLQSGVSEITFPLLTNCYRIIMFYINIS